MLRGSTRATLAMLLLLGAALPSACDAGEKAAAPTHPTSMAVKPPSGPTPPSTVEHLAVQVVAVWPHDPTSFTQGLVWDGRNLLESVGQYGSSALLRVERESGRALQRVDLDAHYFGEGLALAGDRVVQLTWREGKAFAYRAADFAPTDALSYAGEGWGLTFDGSRLWMSDGSDTLTVRDARTLAVVERRRITLDGRPRDYLNELEWVDGKLYANVWQSDEILRIDPASGRVEAVIDAGGLLSPQERAGTDVLNGIAYDPARKVFLLTGKLWPKLFEVTFGR